MDKKLRFQIIEYAPCYASDFQKLNLEWIEHYFKVEQKDIDQTSDPDKNILQKGGQIFFIMEGDIVAGTCAVTRESEGVYEIAKMAVRPDMRGLGLGNMLMQTCIDWCRKQKASEILILSNTILEPAIELYKKFGFIVKHLGSHPDYERCNIELGLHLAP